MLALTAIGALAAVVQDEVTALPGWDKALPSKHYSGYLNIDEANGRAFTITSSGRTTTPQLPPSGCG